MSFTCCSDIMAAFLFLRSSSVRERLFGETGEIRGGGVAPLDRCGDVGGDGIDREGTLPEFEIARSFAEEAG